MPRSSTRPRNPQCVKVSARATLDTPPRHTPSTQTPLTRARLKELLAAPKVGKYRNQKAVSFDLEGQVIKLDSKREARRWSQLVLRHKAGEIKALERQVRFRLEVNGQKICTYVADFVYLLHEHLDGREYLIQVVEDAKGVRTDTYKLKKKLMKACHGIEVREV